MRWILIKPNKASNWYFSVFYLRYVYLHRLESIRGGEYRIGQGAREHAGQCENRKRTEQNVAETTRVRIVYRK